MNHRVPDFEFDDIYSLPTSSGLTTKSAMADEEIMELLWQNGQVVTQSQNQRSGRRIPDHPEAAPLNSTSETQSAVVQAAEASAQQANIFMQEDEMASWLHYPLHDSTFERDITQYFNPPPPPPPSARIEAVQSSQELKLTTSIELKLQSEPSIAPSRPPVPPSVKNKEVEAAPPPRRRVQNFVHFKKQPAIMIESRPSSKAGKESAAVESTVVGSNDTPKISEAGSSRIPEMECGTMSMNEGGGNSGRELTNFTVTSSPGDSSASITASVEPASTNEAAKGEDRKRKGREGDDNEGHSLENEFEVGGEKKEARGSTSTKRSRAAEVHNLSERRRRDRINERMKTLQELIPRCNKTDKASMLDEAIEYLKSLQMQVQMMSMGCGMVPIMYPGVQQYMPAMGMAMDFNMNRPLVPYSGMLQGPTLPNPAAGAQMAPRFPMPAYHMPAVHDPSRMQALNTVDPLNPIAGHNPHPNLTNPYQQYLAPQQGQVLMPQQYQAAVQPNNSKPSSSRDDRNPENDQPGG